MKRTTNPFLTRHRSRWFSLLLSIAATAISQGADLPLNGPWRFAYTSTLPRAKVVEKFTVAVMVKPPPRIPDADQFALDLQVPGYWDEQLSYLPEAPWGNSVSYYEGTGSSPIRFPYPRGGRPRHPDAGRAFIVGTGWYKKAFAVPDDWRGRVVTLHVGGARIDTYCFVNGIYTGMHHGHDTPFEFDVTDQLTLGETNEVKYIRLQAAMWEARTKGGRLFVAAFNFRLDDPAAVALLDGMVEYVQSDGFQPRSTVSIADTLTPVLRGVQFKGLRGNDGNYYPGNSLY